MVKPVIPQDFELTPSAVYAMAGPPKGSGPWAINSAGDWFKVTKRAPGSKIVGNIYVPPSHPSVRKTIPELQKKIPAEVRFTDPKMIAANRATVKGAFYDLFFNIAPRGCGPEGLGAGREFQDSEDDYDCEGGNLYPSLSPGDSQALELAHWWGSRHAWDRRYGTPNQLSLNWLRVYTDSNGYQRYKPWSRGEVSKYFDRWMLAKDGYVCGGDEVLRLANQTMSEQSRRQAAQPEGAYTPHYVWHIGPLSQCAPTSSSRRRKAIKKAAAIGAVVAGGIFLGKFIAAKVAAAGGASTAGAAAAGAGTAAEAGAATAAAAAGGGAASTAATAAGAAAALSKGAKAADATKIARETTTIMERAQEITPKVVDAVNQARTIKAVADGEVPPPPISLEGDSFKDWALSIATQQMEKDYKEKMSAIEQQELEREISRLAYQANQNVAQSPQPYYPHSSPSLDPNIQAIQELQAAKANNNEKMMIYGGMALLALVALRGGL